MKASAEAAQRMLKDLMFRLWADDACESASDIVKLLSLIDFYLPFMPLEREHINELFKAKLQQRAQEMLTASQGQLTWGDEIVNFLVSKVCFQMILSYFSIKLISDSGVADLRAIYFMCRLISRADFPLREQRKSRP